MGTINMFTKDEQVILKNVSSKYKWIARDSDGTLFLFNKKPAKYTRNYGVGSGFLYYFRLEPFEDIFKGVTWDGGPVQFRKDVLDETDLISRQAAIDILKSMAVPRYLDSECEDIYERDRTLDKAIDAMRSLPSAQPAPCEFCKHNNMADDKACLMCSAERRTE